MSAKAWIIFVAAVVILFGSLVVFSQRNRVDVSSVNDKAIINASEDNGKIGDHIFGKADSKVVLVEYGDFQCPGCGAAHITVKPVMDKYEDQVAFVFRNFPLTNIHPNARAAAAAVEAAGLQGKYWEMHNKVFESQDDWSDANATERTNFFSNYAAEVGLDKQEFTNILSNESSRINKKISFDQALGRKVNVTGTPTFYLNGEKLNEEQFGSEEELEKTLLQALNK